MTSCTYHHHRAQCSGGLLKSHRAACQTALRKTAAAVRVVARGMDKPARLFPDAAVEKRPADILDADATLRAVEGRGQTFSSVRISIVFGWVVAAVMVPIYNKIASA
jgi:hypothetical protein